MEFLKEDLKHLFDDQGIDPAAYDDAVEFVDPITRYSSAKGTCFRSKDSGYSKRSHLHIPLLWKNTKKQQESS